MIWTNQRLASFHKEALSREGTDPFYHDAARIVEGYLAILELLPALDGLYERRMKLWHHDD